MHALKYIQDARPPLVGFENVLGLAVKKGVPSVNGVIHDVGSPSICENLKLLIAALEELQYSVVATIVDPRKYGVPQCRRRTWIVAVWTPFHIIPNMNSSVAAVFGYMEVAMRCVDDFLLDTSSDEYQHWKGCEDPTPTHNMLLLCLFMLFLLL